MGERQSNQRGPQCHPACYVCSTGNDGVGATCKVGLLTWLCQNTIPLSCNPCRATLVQPIRSPPPKSPHLLDEPCWLPSCFCSPPAHDTTHPTPTQPTKPTCWMSHTCCCRLLPWSTGCSMSSQSSLREEVASLALSGCAAGKAGSAGTVHVSVGQPQAPHGPARQPAQQASSRILASGRCCQN